MSNQYFDEEEKEFVQDIKRDRTISKKAFLWGAYGLTLMGIDCFSNQFGMDLLSKSMYELNFNELVHTAIFGASSLLAMGGGAIYAISYIMDPKINNTRNKNKTKGLENNLKD